MACGELHAQGLRGAVLYRVGNRHDADQRAINRDEHRGLALGAQDVGLLLGGGRVQPHLTHHRGIAERHCAVADLAAHTLAGDSLEVGSFQPRSGLRLGTLDDRLGQRVFGVPL
jgi:hypothetical protein